MNIPDETYNLDLEFRKYFKPGLLVLDKAYFGNQFFDLFPMFNFKKEEFQESIKGLIQIKAEGGKGYVAKYQLRNAEDYGWYGF